MVVQTHWQRHFHFLAWKKVSQNNIFITATAFKNPDQPNPVGYWTSALYLNHLTCIHRLIEKSFFTLTRSAPRPKRPGLRGRVDSSEHGHPLCGAGVEVVVVGDGGDPEAGVVLRRGVGPIAVPRVVREAGLPVISEFCCFFILTLDTAHSLLSVGGERKRQMKLARR